MHADGARVCSGYSEAVAVIEGTSHHLIMRTGDQATTCVYRWKGSTADDPGGIKGVAKESSSPVTGGEVAEQ